MRRGHLPDLFGFHFEQTERVAVHRHVLRQSERLLRRELEVGPPRSYGDDTAITVELHLNVVEALLAVADRHSIYLVPRNEENGPLDGVVELAVVDSSLGDDDDRGTIQPLSEVEKKRKAEAEDQDASESD